MVMPPCGRPPARRGRADAEVRPHVELDLLGQPQPVVEQGRQPVAGPGPGLDLEVQGVAVRLGAELDLARPPGDRPAWPAGSEVSSRRTTRTGPSHGPGMRTTNSSPCRRAPWAPRVLRNTAISGEAWFSLVGHQVDQRGGAHAGAGDPHRVRAVQHRPDARVQRPGARRANAPLPYAGPGRSAARAGFLGAVQRRRPPHVAPADYRDPERPAEARSAAGQIGSPSS